MAAKNYLAEYIERKNFTRGLFNEPEIDPNNISPKEARELLDSLECDLSPENLCCDGELRGAPLKAKTRMLTEAKKALLQGDY
jgi:hypothetical protein